MKHYKKPDGSVWAFELDGSQDELIATDMVALTASEVVALLNPTPVPPTTLQLIEQLEAANPIPQRTLRDTILAVGQIASQLTGQPAADNPTIAAVMALEAQIAALRAQL